MVGRSELIKTLKRDELILLMKKIQISFSDDDNVDTLRKLCYKYVTDNDMSIADFPPIPNAAYEKIRSAAIAQSVSGEDKAAGGEATETDPAASVTALLSKMHATQDLMWQTHKNSTRSVFEFVKHCNRLGLRFGGKQNGEVCLFLEKLDSLRNQYGLQDREVLLVLDEFLMDDAEVWFLSSRDSIKSFSTFCALLRSVFLPPDYDKKLKDEIRNRSQAENEKMEMFVARVKAANRRLVIPMSEAVLFELVVQNVHPYYVEDVVKKNPSSFDELLKIGFCVETIISRKRDYKPPAVRSPLEPVLNRQVTQSTAHVSSVFPPPPPEDSDVTVSAAGADLPTRTCYNCSSSDHLHRSCPVPKKGVFCYGCGKPGITSSRCPCRPSYLRPPVKKAEN